MASDALWIVSFKGYQEWRFDVKDGEVFRVLKKIGEKGRAFRIANKRGLLGQRELVGSLWPVNHYAVARVAVSNLLVFLHKSNPSSCLAAISCYCKLAKKKKRKGCDNFEIRPRE